MVPPWGSFCTQLQDPVASWQWSLAYTLRNWSDELSIQTCWQCEAATHARLNIGFTLQIVSMFVKNKKMNQSEFLKRNSACFPLSVSFYSFSYIMFIIPLRLWSLTIYRSEYSHYPPQMPINENILLVSQGNIPFFGNDLMSIKIFRQTSHAHEIFSCPADSGTALGWMMLI